MASKNASHSSRFDKVPRNSKSIHFQFRYFNWPIGNPQLGFNHRTPDKRLQSEVIASGGLWSLDQLARVQFRAKGGLHTQCPMSEVPSCSKEKIIHFFFGQRRKLSVLFFSGQRRKLSVRRYEIGRVPTTPSSSTNYKQGRENPIMNRSLNSILALSPIKISWFSDYVCMTRDTYYAMHHSEMHSNFYKGALFLGPPTHVYLTFFRPKIEEEKEGRKVVARPNLCCLTCPRLYASLLSL